MLLGVDVGGTFTDAVLLDGGAVHTAKVPTTPREESTGVMRAVEAVLERAGAAAGRRRGLRPRDDGRHQRAAGGARGADGAGRHPRLRRPARDRPPGPARTSTASARRSRRRWSSASCASRRRSGSGPTGSSSRSPRTSPSGWRRRSRPAAPRRSRSACSSPTSTRATSSGSPQHLRERAPRRPRLRLARGAAALPRVRALLDDGDRRLPQPAARPLPRRASARPPPRPGCRSRW